MGSAFMDKIGDKEATVASGMIREVGSTDQGQRQGEREARNFGRIFIL